MQTVAQGMQDVLSMLEGFRRAVANALDSLPALPAPAVRIVAVSLLCLAALMCVRALRRRPGASTSSVTATVPDNVAGYVLVGTLVTAILVVGVGGWAATSELSGAVIAQGVVVVDSNVKKVQHPTGGVVGEIRVKDGDRVRVGDIVVRLDETVTRANLQVVLKQLDELILRQARLKAERDGALLVAFPSSLLERSAEVAVAEILVAERTLFESRRAAREGQKAQLRERIAQLWEEIAGIAGQLEAKSQEIQLVQAELAGQKELWEKNLINVTKYTATQRDAARLVGERSHLQAATAQARGKIAEIELQVIQIEQDLRSEVLKELRETQAKEAELVERRVAAEDQLKRVELRAPQDGVVHQLVAHTVGGVVSASDTIMVIVPDDDRLVVEARIAPQDIDHVKRDATAQIRLTAFNQRTTPEFVGVVQRVSADLTRDSQSNASYFTARISISPEQLKRVDRLVLLPGMPAEVHIKTTERTALSYIIKPLHDQFTKAFREQ